jgi:hypothetical protein
MSSLHRRSRGRSGHGLFIWTRHGDIQPGEVRDNPLRRHCPRDRGGCGSPAFEPCTRTGRGGRVPMLGRYHDARQAPAHDHPENPPSAPVGVTGDLEP